MLYWSSLIYFIIAHPTSETLSFAINKKCLILSLKFSNHYSNTSNKEASKTYKSLSVTRLILSSLPAWDSSIHPLIINLMCPVTLWTDPSRTSKPIFCPEFLKEFVFLQLSDSVEHDRTCKLAMYVRSSLHLWKVWSFFK